MKGHVVTKYNVYHILGIILINIIQNMLSINTWFNNLTWPFQAKSS